MKTLRHLSVLLLLLVVGGVCMACYSSKDLNAHGKRVTVTRDVGYFSKVDASGSVDIEFVQGKEQAMRIEGPKQLVDNIVVEKKGETLYVSYKSNSVISFFDDDVTLYIYSPDLTEVNLRGSCSFDVKGALDTDNLKVSVMGSGEADFDSIVCDAINFEVRGSGDIGAKRIDTKNAVANVFGSGDLDFDFLKADNVQFAVSGSGDLDAMLSQVKTMQLNVVGSGDMDIKAQNCGVANCTSAGSGSITLSGTMRDVVKNVTGSGDIDTSNLRAVLK
ncbi:head GIN domain-containing protein [Prevotella sp.]|uniref:head GIN domain-containing protein n=1 Tax=Prevotella sp. TaxID=59823 RepID=UPI003FEF81E5